MSAPTLSVVVPTYNCLDKMAESLRSIDQLADRLDIEALFVDDFSSDGTLAGLEAWCAERPYARVLRLPANSGGAATPRNTGIEHASGEYLYFHDADDVLLPAGLAAAVHHAHKYACDAMRSTLVVRHGDGREVLADNIPGWDKLASDQERLRAIVRHQSLTCSFVMRRALLLDHEIRFDPARRIGEDIIFSAQVLAASERTRFRSRPVRVYVRTAHGSESVTQRINSQSFRDFVSSWDAVEQILAARSVSFVREHGEAAIRYAFRQFIWFQTEGLSGEAFDDLSTFADKYWSSLVALRLTEREREILRAARNGDVEACRDALRLRVLVAGHDLKFVQGMIPRLRESYDVRIDQWTGLNSHDVTESQSLLEWADLVWVEWLLGAAVWYSQHVRNHQRLIVRTHRTEMTTTYGDRVEDRNVAAYIAIAPHTLGAFSDRYDIPREKFWLIPNWFEVDSYASTFDEKRLLNLAMVGSVPALKGYDRALRLLSRLRQTHPRTHLNVYGKKPEDLEWLMRDPRERAYFEGCETLIDELGLREAVVHHGWVDTREALGRSAFVLSFSEYEGMQVAVGESYCAGSLGLMTEWPGAADCYPEEFVFKDEDEMLVAIKRYLGDPDAYHRAVEHGKRYIHERYDITVVWTEIERLIKSVRA